MKIGEHKILKKGGSIREIWLTKWKPKKRISSLGLAYRRRRKGNGLVRFVQRHVEASKKLRNTFELKVNSCVNGYTGK